MLLNPPDLTSSEVVEHSLQITMNGVRDLIVGEAELGSESDDESFDDEAGEGESKTNGTRANGHVDDSSEEESDDNEEAARQVSSRILSSGQMDSVIVLISEPVVDSRGFHCRG